MYNHLYYFVPVFIDYPYDEFSSLFDIILFIIKNLLAICSSSKNIYQSKFYFIILFILQIFFSFYFLDKLFNHSYLFMKNTYLNKARISFFISKSLIISFAFLVEQNEIINIFFIIISLFLLIAISAYIHFIYNPFHYIFINSEKRFENIIFYLYIISYKNNIKYLFINKLNEHYEKCAICDMCKSYYHNIKKYEKDFQFGDEEKNILIEEEKKESNKDRDNKNELTDLFYLIYDGKNQYFNFIYNLIINYKSKNIDDFKNYSHYYINLYFLMYSNYEKNNITLSLNEKLILEIINQENCSLLKNHHIQIDSLLLSNEFIDLSKKVINQLKIILNSQHKFNKAKNILNLSFLLKEMKHHKYKNTLFDHTVDHKYNTQNLISACSIIYEEIFNISLNNSELYLRDNIQHLDDIFYYNNINDKIISLSFYLNDKNCKIIRAGKDLFSYVNNNLFDIFPLIFKDYQINLFISSILNNYDKSLNKDKKINNSFDIKKKKNDYIKKSTKNLNTKLIKSINKKTIYKRDYVEIMFILGQNISSKIYYKLLTFKITPLFNYENTFFILFDGIYYQHKDTIITIIDYESNNNSKEKIFAFSDPELEKNIENNSISLDSYINLQNKKGLILSKLLSFKISLKLFNIYILIPKDKELKLKSEMDMTLFKETKILEGEEYERHRYFSKKNIKKNSKMEDNLMENNVNITTQNNSKNFDKGIINIKIKSKKEDKKNIRHIKRIIYIILIIIIFLFIFEYIHLNYLYSNIIDFNDSFIKYRKFSKYYFQLFPLTLSLACIQQDLLECKNLVSYYCEKYYSIFPDINYDITLLLKIQGERITNKILEKTTILTKINNLMGAKLYEEFFGRVIYYTQITQTFTNGYIKYGLNLMKAKFNEAIFFMVNSFNIIYSKSENNSIIYFLNKTNQSFSFAQNIKRIKKLTDYQKEIYELILNYKIYDNQYNIIEERIENLLIDLSNKNKTYIYIYYHLNTIFFIFIFFLIFFGINYFENMIVKIFNFINMTINIKTDTFIFKDTFKKKLENLEIILQLYNGEPVKAIQNLNNIYNDYQQFILKNKNDALEMAKKGYRKSINEENKKNIMNNISKNLRIFNKNEIKNINLINKYLIIVFLVIIAAIILYIILLILWINYFNIEYNLYILLDKNASLETTLYRAINIYYIIIFNNFTLTDIINNIYSDLNSYEGPNSILLSFYENLQPAFDSQKEKNILGDLYEVFEKDSNFSCEILFKKNDEFLEEMEATLSSKKITKIKNKLLNYCNNSRIDESHDSINVFERHFQYISNGLLSLNDFTYNGLITHLKNGNLGEVTLFFSNVIIFLCEILFHKPNKKTKNNVLALLKKYIQITEVSSYIILFVIIIIVLFLIYKIKIFLNQILLLKNAFKIVEMQ